MKIKSYCLVNKLYMFKKTENLFENYNKYYLKTKSFKAPNEDKLNFRYENKSKTINNLFEKLSRNQNLTICRNCGRQLQTLVKENSKMDIENQNIIHCENCKADICFTCSKNSSCHFCNKIHCVGCSSETLIIFDNKYARVCFNCT